MKSKVRHLYQNSCLFDYDFILLTETWIQSDIVSSELFDSSVYDILRKDRDLDMYTMKSGGGGVLVAHMRKYCVSELTLINVDYRIDYLFLRIVLHNVIDICLLLVYIPPGLPVGSYVSLLSALESASVIYNKRLLIVGDFNVKEYCLEKLGSNSAITDEIGNFAEFFGLLQQNTVCNVNGYVLDLIFANFDFVKIVRVEPLTTNEDRHHPTLNILLSIVRDETYTYVNSTPKFNFRKADFFCYTIL